MLSACRMTSGLRSTQRERTSVTEWLQTLLLAANLLWTSLCLGGYRAETMLVTVALTGSLLVVHFAANAAEKRSWRATDPASACMIPFLVYALINVQFVTPVPWLGWLDWLGWANMLAVFYVVRNGVRSSRTRRLLFVTLVILGIAAVALGCYQRYVQPDWLMLGRRQANQFLGRASGPFGIPNSL